MNNDEKMKQMLEKVMPDVLYIHQIMEENNIPAEDIVKALYLIANVKKMTQWGKVTILIKDREIVSVTQEQQFITSRELERLHNR